MSAKYCLVLMVIQFFPVSVSLWDTCKARSSTQLTRNLLSHGIFNVRLLLAFPWPCSVQPSSFGQLQKHLTACFCWSIWEAWNIPGVTWDNWLCFKPSSFLCRKIAYKKGSPKICRMKGVLILSCFKEKQAMMLFECFCSCYLFIFFSG